MNARGVAVDASGQRLYLRCNDVDQFSVKNALHAYSGNTDAFLLKLSPSGQNILFSTYLGGSGDDFANDIAIDPAGDVVIVGTTTSSNFVTAHPIQPAFGGGASDAFVAKFFADGSGQHVLHVSRRFGQ